MIDTKAREWWICFDGVNDRGFWVETKRPSGISGGGNNQSIHVIEYSAYEAKCDELERLKEDIEVLLHEGRQGELEQANVGLADENLRLKESLEEVGQCPTCKKEITDVNLVMHHNCVPPKMPDGLLEKVKDRLFVQGAYYYQDDTDYLVEMSVEACFHELSKGHV